MTVLHLGVIDLPYSDKDGNKSTGQVAQILEDKYHVMEIFAEENIEMIGDALVNSVEGAIESLLMGASEGLDPFGTATSGIKNRFSEFILHSEIEKLGYPGIPTQAALDGVSHRKKHPYAKKNKRRPSFYDSGLYESSFISWVD